MTVTTTQPTVYLVLGGDSMVEPSAIAYEDSGEILETVTWVDGKPDWTDACICDFRGAGGVEGFDALRVALNAGERNMSLGGYDIVRVPRA